jgi:hypothetical protein
MDISQTVGGSLSAAPRCPRVGLDFGFDQHSRQLTSRQLRGAWGARYRAWFVVVHSYASSLMRRDCSLPKPAIGWPADPQPSQLLRLGPLSPSRVSSRAAIAPPLPPRSASPRCGGALPDGSGVLNDTPRIGMAVCV